MKNYLIELEIYQGNPGQAKSDSSDPDFVQEGYDRWQVGQKFRYPDEPGELGPWLVDRMTGIIRALENGGELPWRYPNTPYEKVIDPDGVTWDRYENNTDRGARRLRMDHLT